MILPPSLLAQVDLEPIKSSIPIGKTGALLVKDILLIAAVGLALTLVLLLWARWYVHHRHHRHHHHSSPPSPAPAESGHRHRHRRRHRRRHEEFRTRNPTLAETGGLPPMRTPDSPSKPPA